MLPLRMVREVWTAHIGQVRQILESRFFKRASANSYNSRCSANSGEIAGGTRRDLQGNLYRRRLDKGTCGY